MDIIEAINTRKSIRAFKQDPIPKVILEDILKMAIRSPSAANIQPWEFVVITGEAMKKLTEATLAKFDAGETGAWDLRRGGGRAQIPEAYLKRLTSVQKQMQEQMGPVDNEEENRVKRMRRGFRYFGAPAVIIITMEKALGDTHFFDIGIVTQTICLAAVNHGLGTCIQGQGVMYPDVIRKLFNIPESKHLVIAIAIGYPNWTHPLNTVHTTREPMENITKWLGF